MSVLVLMLVSACAAEPTFTPIPATVAPTLIPTRLPTQLPIASPTASRPPASDSPTATAPRTQTPLPTPTDTPPAPTRVNTPFGDRLASGARLFRDYLCDSCHYTERPFPGGLYAPNLGNIATEAERIIRLPAYQGQAKTAAEYIRESVLEPNVYIVPGDDYVDKPGISVMYQNFAREMAPADLDLIVEYLLSLDAK